MKIKRFDAVVILLFLLAAAIFFCWNKYSLASENSGEKFVEIYSDNKLYQRIDISGRDQSDTIRIQNDFGENILVIEDGGVLMEEADCPDQICAKTGFIDKPGQSIVCLPHKLVIQIIGNEGEDDGSGADVVTR